MKDLQIESQRDIPRDVVREWHLIGTKQLIDRTWAHSHSEVLVETRDVFTYARYGCKPSFKPLVTRIQGVNPFTGMVDIYESIKRRK